MPRALIVAPSWIGDTVLAQPLFARLHAAGVELDALAPPWVAPVLSRMPEIGQIIASPFAHGQLALKSRYRLARQLAEKKYDRAYILPNSLKSALIPFFAGIPQRIGFVGEARYGLVNRRHRLNKTALPLMVERYAQLAELPGVPPPRPIEPPKLVSTAEQQAAALRALGKDAPRRPIVFCPGAEYGPAKRWPAKYFAILANTLAERGHDIWLLGSPKDAPIAETIVKLAPETCTNLCGKTALDQAIDLMAGAELVVCNDSGLMHVAAALGRPLVALFGSSSPAFTPPLSSRATVLSLGLECSPCFERECPLGHFDCLNKLMPARVLETCLSYL